MSHPGFPLEEFLAAYERKPGWEIDRPQPAIARLLEAGAFRGRVLDVGCGTGENAILLASRGLEVVGVDAVPRAVERAREKARSRGVAAEFLVHDVRDLGALGGPFDCAFDSGVFHVFSDPDRPRVVDGLAAVLAPGAPFWLLVFSDRETDPRGPRKMSEEEIRMAFAPRFSIAEIREERYDTTFHAEGSARAWLATMTRR